MTKIFFINLCYNFESLPPPDSYKIAHLLGKPHGPSLSFSSLAVAPFSFFVVVVPSWVFFAVAPFPLPFSAAAVTSPSLAPSLPCSHAKETVEIFLPNCSPWMVASSNSRGVGWREPSAPANVPAPQGEPPWTSFRLVSRGKVCA